MPGRPAASAYWGAISESCCSSDTLRSLSKRQQVLWRRFQRLEKGAVTAGIEAKACAVHEPTKANSLTIKAAAKLIYLALQNIQAKWKRPPRE